MAKPMGKAAMMKAEKNETRAAEKKESPAYQAREKKMGVEKDFKTCPTCKGTGKVRC